MANILYPKGKEHLLGGDIALDSDTIKAVLVDTADYTYNAADEALDDIPAGARVATGTLASKTITGGVFDAANLTFTAVTGDPSEAVVIYKDSGVESTSYLIARIDSATGLPVTPNGGDITVNGMTGQKIFLLTKTYSPGSVYHGFQCSIQ
jgi:hypothetical protein